jgi:hypothetical protein
MAFKTIVYLSSAKLDLYVPQIPPRFLAGVTAKVKADIGVFSAEIGGSDEQRADDISRLQRLLSYLEAQHLVGDEIEAKPFVRGTLNVSALLDGGRVFFTGTMEEHGESVTVCLCASAKHISGYDAKIEDDPTKAVARFGSVEAAIFHLNSNTVYFSDRLMEVSGITQALAETPQPLDRTFNARDFLDEAERSAHSRFAFLNPIVRLLYPSNPFELDLSYWKRELAASILLGPLFFLLLGPGGRARKRRAVARLQHSEKYQAASNELSAREQQILDAAFIVSGSHRVAAQQYEFVARRLLQGISFRGQKVLLASPLYMAVKERYD